MREKIAKRVSRVLDEFTGTDDLRSELLEARVVEAANETVDALENEILPELHKLEAKVKRGDLERACSREQELLALTLSTKCEETESTLLATRKLLEDEKIIKREALDRAFHEGQEKLQEQSEKERYKTLWLEAERRALAAEARVAYFFRPDCASFTSSYVY